jgi:hypothetical protein
VNYLGKGWGEAGKKCSDRVDMSKLHYIPVRKYYTETN